MLIGLFMEVEHPAIYKPAPELKAALLEPGIKQCRKEVYDALRVLTRNSKL